jgi:aryl-alcohol dehydrogenase-like predicted oxidoreductase
VLSLPFVTVGTMNFGGRTPEPEAKGIVHRALERGACVFDTANVYGDGEAERVLGRALVGRGEAARVATKVGLLRRDGRPEGLAARWVKTALDESLVRLGRERVDLYYLHAPDEATPLEETLDGVQAVLESGKAAAWGVSNFAAWQIGELNTRCDARGMPRPAVSQVLYNLLVRQLDLEYFAFARRHPIHTTVYNPLAGGLLAREVAPGAPVPPGSRFEKNKLYRQRYWSDALLERAAAYRALGREVGMEPSTFAYAFLRGTPGVDSVLAGPASCAHLDAALDACDGPPLPADLRAKVDALHRAFTGTDVSYAR